MTDADGFAFFVGIDWGSQAHQVCVLDARGEILGERRVLHTAAALEESLRWFEKLTGGALNGMAMAIEVPHGPLVETLLERGLTVFSLNPKQLDRFRDRYFPAGAKDDRRDAFVLGSALRTDRHCFRMVQRDDPRIVRLRDLSRLEEELGTNFHRYACQLREQLQRYYPQLLALSPQADEPWLWSLLEAAPDAAKSKRLLETRIGKWLRAHRVRRLRAAEVVEQLRAPGFALTPGTVEAASEHALLLVPHLRLLAKQRAELAQRIETVLEELAGEETTGGEKQEHRDVTILRSLPGAGRVVAATMLAEAAQALAERDYHALRAYAGVAPLTRQSGKHRSVQMRYSCNARMRNATYHWARVSTQHDEVSREHYRLLRARGHSHGRALRGVADRLLAVLCAMLRSGTIFDASRRHGSLTLRTGTPPHAAARRKGTHPSQTP
jgi:transposase